MYCVQLVDRDQPERQHDGIVGDKPKRRLATVPLNSLQCTQQRPSVSVCLSV